MKKYLVVGNPIEHSLSPKLHNYWIKNNNINAIYEKKKLNDFAIFVGANEEIAEKKLIAFSNHLKEQKPLAFTEIQNILKELEFSFCGFTDTKNIYNTFDDFIRINEDSYNLDIWKKIEEKYKDTFDTMYADWVC